WAAKETNTNVHFRILSHSLCYMCAQMRAPGWTQAGHQGANPRAQPGLRPARRPRGDRRRTPTGRAGPAAGRGLVSRSVVHPARGDAGGGDGSSVQEAVGPVLAEERRRQLLQWLEEEGRIQVTDAARRLAVSPMTVRRDLERLEADGLLVRTHGGALPVGTATPRELPYASKRARQVE